MLGTLKFIFNHPLNRKHKLRALARWAKWQVGSRLVPGPVAVPFVDNTRLLVSPGMTGATGNLYCGLHEFEDMAFLLHFLRSEDMFVDIGANIGSYTVLAAGAVGSHTISIEPIPQASSSLQRNLDLNGIAKHVEFHPVAVGRDSGSLSMSNDQDTVNHVLADTETIGCIDVPVHTLDDIVGGREITLVKIDVEGYESEVLTGGQNTLSRETLKAVIMELNGSGERYGFNDDELHREMLAKGFRTFRYNPFSRELINIDGGRNEYGNTLYLRDVSFVSERLAAAPKFRVHDHHL